MTALAAGTLVLAGCTSGGSGTTPAGTRAAAPATAAPARLSTASTSLGTVVVDGRGRTVYEFDQDVVGAATTACTGQCADFWAEVTTSSAPLATGLTGRVGTAAGAHGAKQVTLEGHRLYTFVKDTLPGDVVGQGFARVWWVLSPAGELVKGSAAAPS
jgi:predicted lipoprotein with Yx(FWY)xxD motif